MNLREERQEDLDSEYIETLKVKKKKQKQKKRYLSVKEIKQFSITKENIFII